jgi:hypothetical protein
MTLVKRHAAHARPACGRAARRKRGDGRAVEELQEFERAGEGDYDVGEAFGDHHIEYWIYDGRRLTPASSDQAERLREMEAWLRLEHWKAEERRRERRRAWWRPWFAGRATVVGPSSRFQPAVPAAVATPSRETAAPHDESVSQPEPPTRDASERAEP